MTSILLTRHTTELHMTIIAHKKKKEKAFHIHKDK